VVDQRLVCHLEGDEPVSVIRLDGVLDVDTTPALRAAVLRRLAGRPDAVVVDLAGLMVGDDVALTVFPTLARDAARYAGGELILCAATEPVVGRLRNLAILRYVPMYPTRAEALAYAAKHRPPQLFRLHLPASPPACVSARGLVAHACGRWHLTAIADCAALVVTELVANAVGHARTPSVLTVSLRTRHLHLSVEDGSPVLPRRGSNGPHAPGGRGLLVVEAFTSAWGSTATPTGKVVWAAMRRPPPDRYPVVGGAN
jgi:anti-anti-sigma regulatory factor/anti-sigma regulatory factor (Ser/Thr protein kinase)